MASDRDQYIQFTIKLLKGSFALNALWQDALNYHMIDQPEKLIAMRLTEYYELVSREAIRPGPNMQGSAPNTQTANLASAGNNAVPTLSPTANPGPRNVPPQSANGNASTRTVPSQPSEEGRIDKVNDIVTRASALVVEQNADDAADYWSSM